MTCKDFPTDLILKTVGTTFGPLGKTVMLDRPSGLLSTKDGQMILWELWPKNRNQKIFLTFLQEAITHLNSLIGDGTTTATVFIALLFKELQKYEFLIKDIPSFARRLNCLYKEIEENQFWFSPFFMEESETFYQFCLSVSNQDEEMARAAARALTAAGGMGLVSVEEGKSRGVEISQKKGYIMEQGQESNDFEEVIYEECLVACIDSVLEKAQDIVPVLEEASGFSYPLLIISNGLYSEALQTVLMNHKKLKRADGSFMEIATMRSPGRPDQQIDILEDLAALSGSKIWKPGLTSFESSMLGAFEKCELKRKTKVFHSYQDKEEEILQRVKKLEKRVLTSTHDQNELQKRIALMTSGFIVLEVGGSTFTEIAERKARLEDVLSVSKVALDGGIIPGGAMSYLQIFWRWKESKQLEKKVFANACYALWKFLVKGEYPVISHLDYENPWLGYDLVQKKIRNFQESPLLGDSWTGFLKTLEISCSLASQFLLVESMILCNRK